MPYSLGREAGGLRANHPNVFQFLTFLAGPSVVTSVGNYLMAMDPSGRTRINRLENLLCLNAEAHLLFGGGLFVLEPVGDPLASLNGPEDQLWSYNVMFSWVPGNQPRPVILRGIWIPFVRRTRLIVC